MKPRDFTNFSTEALMEELKALADDLSEDPRALIIEAMDRIELLTIEAQDLAHGMRKARQDSDFWKEKATKSMNKSKRLEEAGDAMFIRSTRVGREIWTKAKEAKP